MTDVETVPHSHTLPGRVPFVSGVTERCLISTDSGFYARWRSFMAPVGFDLYACPITCPIAEGMLDPSVSCFLSFFFLEVA